MSTNVQQASLTIVHELEQRLRVRSPLFIHSEVDPAYLEATVENVPGVTAARVNTRASCMVVEFDGRSHTREAVLCCLLDLPREVFNGSGQEKTLRSPLSLIGRGTLVGAMLFLPPVIKAPIALAMAAPVIYEGVVTLFRRGIKVEVLDGSAVLFSLVMRDYFTAASIVFLLFVGEYLEEQSEDRTTGLLKSLLKPQVQNIWIELNGQELEIPVQNAQIGDHVICGPGELVPLDGIVIEGEGSVNTSSITGESVPVHVSPGSEILSGSVVEEGRLVFEAIRVGAETSMARISKFLENSLRNESQSQKKSDELADKLVPVTFGLGLGLLSLTRDLQKAAAVLTVDYSCAIKLTTPVAVRVAMFTAANQGVLLKGAQAVDTLARVDTLVFDKTGTLTKGDLQVTDICTLHSYTEDEVLILAASAEEHYSHPIASTVLRAAGERALELAPTSQVDFIVAHGVSAYIDGKNVLVGSRHFIEDDEGVSCAAVIQDVERLQEEGKSLLYVACEEKLVGIIGLRDELRPEAPWVLGALKQTGISKIVILTGDSDRTAKALAAQLPSVDEVHSELKPEDKAAIVRELQAENRKIGFVGDGVNDAPALVSADLGICLPEGADLAKESAQVILLKDDLETLLKGRLIAQKSEETIKRSFISAVGLNSSFLLLATFGLLQPVTSALLHNFSTLGIVGYAAYRGRKEVDVNKEEDNNRE
ncbi:MAG: heavy metal translocating P-type ATPase [Desulfobulbus propionicus]|nr:MAG: heavy metal translocating P-type ATPase [Desulfobulbus propionicus]